MIDDILFDTEEKMEKAVAVTREEFGVIRTGRAHPACSTSSRPTTTAPPRR